MSELMPTNIEAEEAILGGILIDPYALDRVIDTLKPYHFAISAHSLLYRAMLEVKESGHPVDMMTVTVCLADSNWLEEVGGQSKLAQLAERTVSAVNVDCYVDLLVDKYIRRRLIFAANEAVKLGYDTGQSIEDIETQIASAFAKIKLEKNYAKESSKLTTSLFEWASQSPPKPTQWLVQDLFRCKDIILVSGATGSGKSTILSSIFRCIAKGEDCLGKKVKRGKVLWHTSDEPEDDLFVRLTGKWKVEADNPDCWSKNFIKLDSSWNYHRLAELEQILEADQNQPDGTKIKAICIDSLASAIVYPLGLDINSAEMGNYVKAFKPLAEKYGVAIFIIHHENKDRDAKGVSKANGSRTIVNHSDMMITVAGEPRNGVLIKASKVRGVVAPWEIKAVLENEPHVMGVEGSLSCHLILQSYARQESAAPGDDDIDLKSLPPREAIAIFLSANRDQWYRRVELQENIGHTGASKDEQYKIVLKEMVADGVITLNPNPARTNWPEYGHLDNKLVTVTSKSTANPMGGASVDNSCSKSLQGEGLSPTAPPPTPIGGAMEAPIDTTTSCSMPVVVNKELAIALAPQKLRSRSSDFIVGDRVFVKLESGLAYAGQTAIIKELFLQGNPQQAEIELEKKKGKVRRYSTPLSNLEVINES